MKKFLIFMMLFAMLIVSCGESADNKGESTAHTTAVAEEAVDDGPVLEEEDGVFIVTEEKYYEGLREIYGNPEKYLGKRIRCEGEYIAELYGNEMYYQVYRNITENETHTDEDGHVHTHGTQTNAIGFRIKYDGDKPSDKTFVRVEGIFESYDRDGETMYLLRADVLEKCETLGKVDLKY